MPLEPGTELGRYQIVAAIGAGGMGEVYRATDTRLKRDVAIKVLPATFAQDADRMARFEREAQVLASLNHPNIAAIYGLEHDDGEPFLVLELVEGEDLSAVIGRGPIPLAEVLALFVQIAAALSAAHERGIVHRDLKPGNVKLSRSGRGSSGTQVKLLDFGLAKALASADGPTPDLSHSPTLTQGTALGLVLGTASYMSPEQARGQEVDRRTDIWAFGACLFEALSGRRAFPGAHVTDVLASVVRGEPEWSRLPAETPVSVRALLERCLRKDADRRLHDIADARIELEDALAALSTGEATTLAGAARRSAAAGSADSRAGTSTPAVDGPPRPARVSPAVIVAGALFGALAVTLGILLANRAEAPDEPGSAARRPPVRFEVARPPQPSTLFSHREQPQLALSPDGRRLVLAGDESSPLQVRSLDRFESEPLAGTEGAQHPFFSPDGEWIGFVTKTELRKIPSRGGTPVTLARIAPVSRGASWGPSGVIVYAPSYSTGLMRISADGGVPATLTELDQSQGETSHLWPQVLPDGDTVLFTVWKGGSFDDARVERVSLSTGERRLLIEGGHSGRLTASGHLLFVRGGALHAVAFDLERGEPVGTPAPVLDGLAVGEATGAAQYTVSANGTLAFLPPRGESLDTFVWVDTTGAAEPVAVAEGRDLQMPRLSPDGRRVALQQFTDLWLFDLERETRKRLTFRAINLAPQWSPDGERIAFSSTLEGEPKLFVLATDGSDEPFRVTDEEPLVAEFMGSWSSDGLLAYSRVGAEPGSTFDIWVVKLDDPGSARPLVATEFQEHVPDFSPGGELVAYVSDESGRPEVYVRSLADGSTWPVSTDGGTEPVWARDGTRLYYRDGPRMLAVTVRVGGSERFSASRPELLFEGDYRRYDETPSFPAYDLAPDGERFLMNRPSRSAGEAEVRVVLDWLTELEELGATGG